MVIIISAYAFTLTDKFSCIRSSFDSAEVLNDLEERFEMYSHQYRHRWESISKGLCDASHDGIFPKATWISKIVHIPYQ